ncbi:MAG: holo-[acyl-carrier-protein] synthase, partial [Bacteroidetes bacterium]
MVSGIGIDMIEVDRIAEKIGKETGFKELVFSVNEIRYCEAKAHKFEHYAARFAAKEAFLKAIGTGWTSGTAFNEIEIVDGGNGQPEVVFIGATAKTVLAMNIKKVWVSVSHLKA